MVRFFLDFVQWKKSKAIDSTRYNMLDPASLRGSRKVPLAFPCDFPA
jgi:hypothetical protein